MRVAKATIACALVLLGVACGAMDDRSPATRAADGGVGAGDAFFPGPDGCACLDAEPPSPRSPDEIPAEATDLSVAGRSEWLLGCFDGVDPDRDDIVDCAEMACQTATPACCVGIANARCCATPSPSVTFDFGSCTAGSPAACTVGATAFGIATPSVVVAGSLPGVTQNAIMMNGSDDSDSGLVLTRTVDFTSRRVTITASIGTPADCGVGCLQTAAIAVTARGDYAPGRADHVRPLLALIVTASRHEVLLVQGDTVVASTGIASEVATYELTFEPNGDVTATGGLAAITTRWAPTSAGHLAFYGRNVNPSMATPLPARFESLTVSEGLCNMPRAWGPRAQAVPQLGTGMPPMSTWPGAPRIVRAPSVAARPDTGARVLAFETERGIYLAGESMDGQSYSPLMGDNVALVGGRLRDGTGASSVGEPSLVPAASGVDWDLYVTVADATGAKRWIARTTRAIDATSEFPEAQPIAVSVDGLAAESELSSPEVVSNGGNLEMFARYGAGGEARIIHLRSVDGGASWFGVRGGSLEQATVRIPSHDPSTFDGDDVSGPAVVRQNGGWELYFTGRRGARAAIGVLSSFDLDHFWDAGGGEPVLSASGSGFDALSVAEPAVFSLGERVVMLYGGTDGADWRIGRVERAATAHRAP